MCDLFLNLKCMLGLADRLEEKAHAPTGNLNALPENAWTRTGFATDIR